MAETAEEKYVKNAALSTFPVEIRVAPNAPQLKDFSV